MLKKGAKVNGVNCRDLSLAPSHIAISDEKGVSDNLGLVIAEALERGKSVITTDGAPAWASYAGQRSKVKGQTKEFNNHCLTSDLGPLTYITGYREGDDKTRVQLLVDAIKYYLY